MKLHRRYLAAAGAAGLMLLAACGGNSSGSAASGGGKYGGTLYVLMNGTMTTSTDNLEPATSNAQESQDLMPLIMSPLTVYVPGSNPTQIAGDLATNAGEPSDGARVWTFHIRKGITYSDGTQVTAQDVKYAVERSFASTLAGGVGGALLNLVDSKNYKGPYVDKGGLASIQTPDPYTIIFHLAAPNYDFNYTTTYPLFSGVPQSKDTGTRYGQDPVTSGPYNIQSFQGGRQLILVRNPRWKLNLVPTIKAYPNEIDYSLGLDPSVIDQRLITDQGNDQAAIDTDSTIQASDVAEVLNNPQVKPREALVTLGANEWMLFMNVTKAPFNNKLVREAMQYAVNKQSFQTATGGPIAGGPIAQQLIGPGILGYNSSYDPYPAPATGDPAKARQLLAQAGFPHGVTVQLQMGSGTPQENNQATAIESALNAAGFKVNLQMINTDSFYQQITMPKTVPQAEVSLWGGAWNDAGQVLGMYDGSVMTPSGPNYDEPQLNDPAINNLIHRAQAAPSAQAAAPMWNQVNHMVMSNGSVVPIINEGKIYLHGSKVTGDIVSDVYGAPTLFDISVAG
jgi:peptide/nickel transport system substrate-binding protein